MIMRQQGALEQAVVTMGTIGRYSIRRRDERGGAPKSLPQRRLTVYRLASLLLSPVLTSWIAPCYRDRTIE